MSRKKVKSIGDIAPNTAKRSVRDFIYGAVIAGMCGPWVAEFLANFNEFLQGQVDAGVLPPVMGGLLLLGLRWLRDYLKHCTTADENALVKILIPVLLVGLVLPGCATVKFEEILADGSSTLIKERVLVIPGTRALADHAVDYTGPDFRLKVGQKADLENTLDEALVDFGELVVKGFEHYLSAGAPQFWHTPDSDEEDLGIVDVLEGVEIPINRNQ